ncbi:MAG: hypothetical protein ACO1PZ_03815 [Gammaproteobacteria bacterium]
MMARLIPFGAAFATVLLFVVLYVHGADPRPYWMPSFATGSAWSAGIGVALAVLLRVVAPAQAVPLLAGIAAFYIVGGLGPVRLGAGLLGACACVLAGRRMLAWMFPAEPVSPTTATLSGLALYLALFGLMIHFQVNYRAIYVILFAAPLIAEGMSGRIPAMLAQIHARLPAARAAAERLPYAAFAAAVLGAIHIARYGFMPTVGYDDNTLHLGMWTQLRFGAIYEFDFRAQVWEVAPFAVDLLHAVVNLVAGDDARGATNVLLLAVTLQQLWALLATFQLTTGSRVLLLALFVSTPLASYSLLMMQTELFMALLATAGVRLVVELKSWCSPHGAALLAVAALCCATKLPGAGLGIMLLASAVLRLWTMRHEHEAKRATPRGIALLALFTAVLATLAFNAYVTAWLKTGNPVFPLYNAIFASPYFEAVNFSDTRWTQGFSLASYWNLFFDTSSFFESEDFVAGFQYLLLFPLGVAALLASQTSRRFAPLLFLPLFGYALFVFAAMQYWRYQFPVMPLATVAIGALLLPHYSRIGAGLVQGAIAVCIVLNLAFVPGISGILWEAPEQAWTPAGKLRMIERFAPARLLNDWVNENAPGSRVLYPSGVPYGATLDGTPLYPAWYSPEVDRAFRAIRDDADGFAFLRGWRVDYIIAWSNAPGEPGSMNWALRHFLSRYALPLVQAGDHVLYRVDATAPEYTSIFTSPQILRVDATPRALGSFNSDAAHAFRYRTEFACESDAGYFAAQINWDNGQYYYHEIPCSASPLQFEEALPIPPGAGGGELWGRVTGTDGATLMQLIIETH